MTLLHPDAAYWSRGVPSVPAMTGAAAVMDCADLLDVLGAFGIAVPLTEPVLDVGCGSGRLGAHCAGGYLGLDISPDAVAYCRRAGLDARLLGPDGLSVMLAPPSGRYGWAACFSVFTHMGAPERRRYLAALPRLAPRLLADVIPGDGSGNASRWTAPASEFRGDLLAAGYDIHATFSRTSPDGETHLYAYAEAL